MLTLLLSMIVSPADPAPAPEGFAAAHIACVTEAVPYLPNVMQYIVTYQMCLARRRYGF